MLTICKHWQASGVIQDGRSCTLTSGVTVIDRLAEFVSQKIDDACITSTTVLLMLLIASDVDNKIINMLYMSQL